MNSKSHYNKQDNKNQRINLTWQEKSELFTEAIITLILLLLLNIALFVIFKNLIQSSPNLENFIFGVKKIAFDNFQFTFLFSWRYIILFLLLAVDIIVIIWRVYRRYKQFQLWHIISELHYIAKGNYEHTVRFQIRGNLKDVVDSINELVASTRKAITEEQRIKKSKDELITNVSHDIRTPLTSIIGYLQLIQNKQYNNEEQLQDYVNIAYKKAKQMKQMVDDLFEYSTLDQPSTNLELSTFDLHELFNQISVDYFIQTKKKNIDLNIETSPNPFIITADAAKLVRVFNNLISNALKYGKNATIIELNATIKNENTAQITIRNNGEPIPKNSLTKLFERFYRVDTSRTQKIEGTGLGLAIAQNIIKLHHGKIWATSDKNWTSFIMEIPIKQYN